jgi:hypothetical protein
MPYVEPVDRATALFVTAGIWNQDVAENQRALFPDGAGAVSWTPGLAGTAGNAAVTTTGRRYQFGAMAFVFARMTITSPGAGFYFVTLPVASSGVSVSAAEGSGQTVGSWTLRDDSGPSSRNGSVLLRAADEIWFNQGPGSVTHQSPFLIASGDVLSFQASYPIA